jgi:DNA processing protein
MKLTAHKPSSDQHKLDWLRLSRTENVGPVTFYKLIETYGTAADALNALPELAKRGGRKKPLSAPPQRTIEKEYNRLIKSGGQIITTACDDYPTPLAACPDAPPVISVLGSRMDLLARQCIGIVGARNASINGRKMAQKLATGLGAVDRTIASGLARGIDTAAHQGSINSGTIAVVAGGIDVVYPEENKALYDEIREKGLIIAESPMGQKPFAQSFPRRNRIVSGLSDATIVIEATLRSGSLITARLAGEQGRDVMAVPGSPLDPRASGPNHLIREGATLVREASDVLEVLNTFSGTELREPDYSRTNVTNFTNPAANSDHDIPADAHETIIDLLSFEATGVDELIRSCDLTHSALHMILLELELAGRIKRGSGNTLSLISED